MIIRDKDNMKQDVLRQKRIHDRQYEFDMVLGEDANQVRRRRSLIKNLHDLIGKYFTVGRSLRRNYESAGAESGAGRQRHRSGLRSNWRGKNLHHGRDSRGTRRHGQSSRRPLQRSFHCRQ